MRRAARTGGVDLPWSCHALARRDQPVPLLVLVDVSGSMERYARLLLTFLHAATAPGQGGQGVGRRDMFAFGTGLTDLTPAFRHADGDAMLAHASAAITDFAGGTRLGEALHQLRRRHARRLVGRRTLVLLISDGLDTGEPAALLQELGWLRRHCGQLLWLNPRCATKAIAHRARRRGAASPRPRHAGGAQPGEPAATGAQHCGGVAAAAPIGPQKF